ncbi:MAG: subclass B3 metallo-beta-lactamase [Pseudomonadota bacterium]
MRQKKNRFGLASLTALLFGAAMAAAPPDMTKMNLPHAPFKIYGNTWYVGTEGLGSILITSGYGHVLIDGGLPQSAGQIAANIETLGFKLTDVKAILNTHVHPDHAGGIAELQRRSGAQVYARRPGNDVLMTGQLSKDDPQYGKGKTRLPRVPNVWVVHDGESLGVGSVRLQAVATPGHTPGGTSWTWESCDGSKCLKMVYADSLSPVSGDKFRFTDNKEYPQVLQDFEQSFAKLENLPCDVLITPHPEVSDFFARIANRPADKPEAIKDDTGCKRFVQAARERLAERVSTEKANP